MRSCPKCKTNEYNNRSFLLMINECGHSLCKNCVDNLFFRNSGPCPTCGKTLKKNGFWEQTLDDPSIERENHVRKKLRKIFNLFEEDFPSLRDYNDYLERFEHIVWNMANDIDVDSTRLEIDRFLGENSSLIERNRKKLGSDDIWMRNQLRVEKMTGKNDVDDEQMDLEAGKNDDAKTVIEQLKNSDLPAEVILDRLRKRQIEAQLVQQEETKLRRQSAIRKPRSRHDPSPLIYPPNVGVPFIYHPLDPPPLCVPPLPSIDLLASFDYLLHAPSSTAVQVVSGFPSQVACYRALFESRLDLFSCCY